MMEKMSNMDEMVSALADGELHGDAFARAMDALATDAGARESWHAYHLVGDVLRSAELASPSNGADFVARFRARLQQEQAAVASKPASLPLHDDLHHAAARVATARAPANAPGFGWPLLAGVASLTAVAAIAWNVLGGAGITTPATAELAQAATQPPQQAQPPRVEAARPVMIRDARLDELLAAHRQAGGASALQMPAGFLRNATFESPGR
jgi:sigma-E factor negative regulatory protein RseA